MAYDPASVNHLMSFRTDISGCKIKQNNPDVSSSLSIKEQNPVMEQYMQEARFSLEDDYIGEENLTLISGLDWKAAEHRYREPGFHTK
uniref:Uncharacterized protein n=1 Tax=Daucus carota subsp. sativus TaxID=79200 RepID=A0A164VSV5_DAUCS